MSFILDGIILICAAVCIVNGVRQGFVKAFLGLVKGIVALLTAYAYTPVLAEPIRENYVVRQIADGIAETLQSLALNLETKSYDLSKVAADMPEAYTSILDRYHIDIPSFTASIANITQADEGKIYDLSAQIAEPCATVVASVAAFALLFLGVYIVLSLAAWLIDLLFHLPVLSAANRFMGFLFGVVEAVFFAWVIAIVGGSLMEALEPIDSMLFGSHVIDNTIICRFFWENNVFIKITNLLQG